MPCVSWSVSPERGHPDGPEAGVDADGEEGPDAAVLGDEAAEVVALQGKPDDALHGVPQGGQGAAAVEMAKFIRNLLNSQRT